MQRDTAEQLQAKYRGRICDHPHFVRQYDRGVQTEDYVCTQCGKAISAPERESIESRRHGSRLCGWSSR